jgi:hypothetical protein
MTDKKCWDGNSHAASGTVFRISKFKDADRNVIFYFFMAFFGICSTIVYLSVAKLCVETGRFTELHLFPFFLSRKHSTAKWFHLSTEIFYKYHETFICART